MKVDNRPNHINQINQKNHSSDYFTPKSQTAYK